MKKIAILFFLLVSISGFSQNFTNQHYIQVVGTAEEKVVPNEIYLQIMINEQDNKGKESVESLENKMVKKLKELDINVDEDLSIKDLSSNFQKYFFRQPDILSSKEYQLILHEATKVGEVYMALEKLGISNLKIEKVDHTDLEKFKEDVRIKAIQNAKQKAYGLAASIQQQIGKAIYIHELETYNPRPLMGVASGISMKRMNEMASANQPNIQFEKIQIESKVEVYFELK